MSDDCCPVPASLRDEEGRQMQSSRRGDLEQEASQVLSSSDIEQGTSDWPQKRVATSITVSALTPVTGNFSEGDLRITPGRTTAVATISTADEGLEARINIPPEILAMPRAQVILEMHHREEDQFEIEVLSRTAPSFSEASANLSPPRDISTPVASHSGQLPEMSGYLQCLETGQQELLDNSRQNIQVLQSIHQLLQAYAVDSRSRLEGVNIELRMMRQGLNALVTTNRDIVRSTNGLALVNRSIVQEIVQCQQDTQCTNQRLVELIQQQQQVNEATAMRLAAGSTTPAASNPTSQALVSANNRSNRKTSKLQKLGSVAIVHKNASKRKHQ
ncbi:hypothetical protein NDU88_006890 [Pleurodeles waltl]|uniref:Uncharacterized protein n=1 Tax=Pleurodeles waltl TaxID=8319 RepID=A0AAV7SR00_PLEWA|nr:hypothetical protein NDU88_006890 [Pleurodeles waltl]